MSEEVDDDESGKGVPEGPDVGGITDQFVTSQR